MHRCSGCHPPEHSRLLKLFSQPPHIDSSIMSMEKNSGFIAKHHRLPFSQWPLFVFSGKSLSSPVSFGFFLTTPASVSLLRVVDVEISLIYALILGAILNLSDSSFWPKCSGYSLSWIFLLFTDTRRHSHSSDYSHAILSLLLLLLRNTKLQISIKMTNLLLLNPTYSYTFRLRFGLYIQRWSRRCVSFLFSLYKDPGNHMIITTWQPRVLI